MAQTLGIAHAPRHRLHAAERAAHHRRPLCDAQPVHQPFLRINPVLDRHHGKIRAIRFTGIGIGVHRAGGTKARTEIIHADHEKSIGIYRLARPHHIIPPARVAIVIHTRDVVRGVQCVANQHRIIACRVQRAVGFVHQGVIAQRRAALQAQWLAKVHGLRCWLQNTVVRIDLAGVCITHRFAHKKTQVGLVNSVKTAKRHLGCVSFSRFGWKILLPQPRPQAESKSARGELLNCSQWVTMYHKAGWLANR